MKYIKEYQQHKGLNPDGVIGKKTIALLMEDLNTGSKERIAHFLGQLHHESMGFLKGRENLTYSKEMLLSLFSKYFTKEEVMTFHRNPERIANRLYHNRMGNGDENSGDGWKYRGVGPIQLTGKTNILGYFKSVSLPESSNPEIILQPQHYFNSAKYFFDRDNLWKFTGSLELANILSISRAINLGNPNHRAIPFGYLERVELTTKYFNLIK